MSEQEKPKSFMQELDEWSDANVIGPLREAVVEGDNDDCTAAVDAIKKAIRAKVLESYHNGQRTPARPQQRGGRYGR